MRGVIQNQQGNRGARNNQGTDENKPNIQFVHEETGSTLGDLAKKASETKVIQNAQQKGQKIMTKVQAKTDDVVAGVAARAGYVKDQTAQVGHNVKKGVEQVAHVVTDSVVEAVTGKNEEMRNEERKIKIDNITHDAQLKRHAAEEARKKKETLEKERLRLQNEVDTLKEKVNKAYDVKVPKMSTAGGLEHQKDQLTSADINNESTYGKTSGKKPFNIKSKDKKDNK